MFARALRMCAPVVCVLVVSLLLGTTVVPVASAHPVSAAPQPLVSQVFSGFGLTRSGATDAAINKMRTYERNENAFCLISNITVRRNSVGPIPFGYTAILEADCFPSFPA